MGASSLLRDPIETLTNYGPSKGWPRAQKAKDRMVLLATLPKQLREHRGCVNPALIQEVLENMEKIKTLFPLPPKQTPDVPSTFQGISYTCSEILSPPALIRPLILLEQLDWSSINTFSWNCPFTFQVFSNLTWFWEHLLGCDLTWLSICNLPPCAVSTWNLLIFQIQLKCHPHHESLLFCIYS